MTRPTLRTAQMDLRPMTVEHLPLLHELDSDPEVMRYLTGRARTAREIDEFWGPRCADTVADRSGLGWWVGFVHEMFVGWWALDLENTVGMRVRDQCVEAGWRVRRAFWRRGLAVEGARAVMGHGFATVGVATIWAETMAVNAGSRAVMNRVGMRHIKTYYPTWAEDIPGSPEGEVVYEITAAEWFRLSNNAPPSATPKQSSR